MKIEELKKHVASMPDLAKRSLIIDSSQACSKALDILSAVIGDKNIENFELITTHISVITLHEGLEHLMDSYRIIKCNGMGFRNVEFTLHSVTPVKFRLQGTLDGILRSSSVDRMESVTLKITELFPELIDVSIVYIPFSCGTTDGVSSRSRGHYCVKAVVNDIKSWYSNVDEKLSVPWEGFMGIIDFKVTGPVMECKGKLPTEMPKGLLASLVKW